MISKRIKDKPYLGSQRTEKPKTRFHYYCYETIDYIVDIYHKIRGNILSKYEALLRSIDFAKFGWKNYDWDSAYIWDVMIFKMERLEKCLKNGHLEQNPENLKALRSAINACKRLRAEEYSKPYFKEHDKKWGKLKTKTKKMDSDNPYSLYSWVSYRDKAKTKEQKEQEYKERMEIYKKEEMDYIDDIDLLCGLFKDHFKSWWD
jgi:replication fork clamp-binding protein CrfC